MGNKNWMQLPRRDHDMSLGDDVPLIDHHKLKESDKRLDDIVEVVAAIVVPVEHWSRQLRVSTVPAPSVPVIPGVLDQPGETLHANDSEEVVK